MREESRAAATLQSNTTPRGGPLARRQNYGFQKRQKELNRQARKEQKAERKRAKKEAEGSGEEQRPRDPSAEDALPEAPGEALAEPTG